MKTSVCLALQWFSCFQDCPEQITSCSVSPTFCPISLELQEAEAHPKTKKATDKQFLHIKVAGVKGCRLSWPLPPFGHFPLLLNSWSFSFNIVTRVYHCYLIDVWFTRQLYWHHRIITRCQNLKTLLMLIKNFSHPWFPFLPPNQVLHLITQECKVLSPFNLLSRNSQYPESNFLPDAAFVIRKHFCMKTRKHVIRILILTFNSTTTCEAISKSQSLWSLLLSSADKNIICLIS